MQMLLESRDFICKLADQSACASIVGVLSTVMILSGTMVTGGSMHTQLPK